MLPLWLPALGLCLAACGEFHTRWLWEEDCPAPRVLVPEVPPQIEAQLNEPLVVRLAANGEVAEWRVVNGVLPPGIRLHDGQGLLWGIPEQEGEFPLVLRAVAPDGLCLLPVEAEAVFHVGAGCDGRDQCHPPAGLEPHCGDDHVCSASGAFAECPAVFGEGIAWSLEWKPLGAGGQDGTQAGSEASAVEGTADAWQTEAAGSAEGTVPAGPWLVEAHRELTRQDRQLAGQEPFTHRIDLTHGKDSAVLRYRLPDLWPLPFREEEELVLASQDQGLAGRELALFSPDGVLAVRLHEGVLLELPPLCPLPACSVPVQQLHLNGCPGEEVQCGRGRPDLLVVGDKACLAGGHVRVEDPAVGWLAVGAAYSYLPGTFRDELCPGVAPLHSSFAIQPESGCPVARIFSAMSEIGVLELGAATEPPPDAVFTGLPFQAAAPDDPLMQGGAPTAPDGTLLVAWHWSVSQPHDGLVALESFKKSTPSSDDGPEPRRLPLTAVGLYSAILHVEDEKGRTSCIPDVAELEVRASAGIDLRIEAVWYDPAGSTQHDMQADLLLMSPPYAQYMAQEHGAGPWPQDSWLSAAFVCSELNSQPDGWKKSPTPPAGPPGSSTSSPDYSCQVAGGQVPLGLPEVITVHDLDRDKKTNRYPVAVLASPENTGPLHVTLRVFLDGKPRYETRKKVVAPGQLWNVGHVDVALEKFVAAL